MSSVITESTCIVLAAPTTNGLPGCVTERGWQIHRCDDALAAMAELCLQERLSRSRAAWGLIPSPNCAVVVLMSTPDAEAMLDAVGRYLPEVERWRVDGETLSALPPVAPAKPAATAPRIAPPLEDAPPPDLSVTSAELAMLLERPEGDG